MKRDGWMGLAGLLGILIFAFMAHGQLSDEEYQKRMAELNQQATSRPTSQPVAMAGPKHWRAKEGAPPYIHQWVASWDRTRAAYLLELDVMIDEARLDLKKIQDRPVPQIRRQVKVGEGSFTDTIADPAEQAAKTKALQTQKSRIGLLAAKKTEVSSPLYIPLLPLCINVIEGRKDKHLDIQHLEEFLSTAAGVRAGGVGNVNWEGKVFRGSDESVTIRYGRMLVEIVGVRGAGLGIDSVYRVKGFGRMTGSSNDGLAVTIELIDYKKYIVQTSDLLIN